MFRFCESSNPGIFELNVDTEIDPLPVAAFGESLVESVCDGGIQVAFVYDAVPLSSVSVFIYSSYSPPYGFQSIPLNLRCVTVNTEREFEIPLKRSIAKDCQIVYTGSWSCKPSFINGFYCDIVWDDGGSSGGPDGSKYKVGLADSFTSGCVEFAVHWDGIQNLADSRCVSFYRNREPFWMIPKHHKAITKCPEETQFVLAEMLDTCNENTNYVALVALIDNIKGLRSSLFGNGQLCMRVETGWRGGIPLRRLNNVRVLSMFQGVAIHEAVGSAISAAAETTKSFSTRSSKVSAQAWTNLVEHGAQPLLNGIGWCSWDACGIDVNEEVVYQTVCNLRAQGVPIAYVIIDDGWQDGGSTWEPEETPFKPPLTSFQANNKFSGTLRNLGHKLQLPLYAWITIVGYWGGVLPFCDDVRSSAKTGTFGKGLLANSSQGMSMWQKEYRVVTKCKSDITKFLRAYYQTMADNAHVFGLKVDGQALLEGLCNDNIQVNTALTRVELCRAYREALELESEQAFGKALVINCMCVSNDVIFSSGSKVGTCNVIWRVTNDHAYPNCEENADAVAWHILSNGLNNVMLGEIFPVCDADMFRCQEWHSSLHAVLRVISGGPIYISDIFPGEKLYSKTATILLSRLLTNKGALLRCTYPGRACADSIFSDPRDECQPFLFKMWNRKAINGLLAVFNLSDKLELHGTFKPNDVLDFGSTFVSSSFVTISTTLDEEMKPVTNIHSDNTSVMSLHLKPLKSLLLHICPVLKFTAGIAIAAVGMVRLLNCGSVVRSLCEINVGKDNDVYIETTARDHGIMRYWMSQGTREKLCCARVENENASWRIVAENGVTFVDVAINDVNQTTEPNNFERIVLLHFKIHRAVDDLAPQKQCQCFN